MIYVVFEVIINEGYMDKYLSLAGKLRDELMKSEGFIRSERFSSLVDERKLLSLSVWESEETLAEWRNQVDHRLSQKQGRDTVFESYTITVASKIRTYTSIDREEAPEDSNQIFKP